MIYKISLNIKIKKTYLHKIETDFITFTAVQTQGNDRLTYRRTVR